MRRPDGEAGIDAFMDYVYFRENPQGRHEEWWHHVQGCRQVLKVVRDTMTHEVISVDAALEDKSR